MRWKPNANIAFISKFIKSERFLNRFKSSALYEKPPFFLTFF